MDSCLNDKTCSRRDYLRLSTFGAIATALPISPAALAAPAAGAPRRLTLDQCASLSPLDMAKRSTIALNSYRYLLKCADSIKDPALRMAIGGIIRQPAPSVLNRFPDDGAKEEIRQQLVGEGLMKADVAANQLFPPASGPTTPPQPFLSAPGSGYMSHHAYPGGLSVHVALNTRSALGLFGGYHDTFGITLARDVVIAAQLLHDLHKPWVFQWQADGSALPEYTVAGTGAHHILGIAESLYRGLPADVVVAQASTHDHPGTPEDEVKTVGYLKAGAIIAGINPIQAGLLGSNGTTVPLPRRVENFVAHLGDHDWIVAVPAAHWSIDLLGEIACEDYRMTADQLKSARFNSFRNYVFSQTTLIGMHQLHTMAGRDVVRTAVHDLVTPA